MRPAHRLTALLAALAASAPAAAGPPKPKAPPRAAAADAKNDDLARNFYKTGMLRYERGEFLEAAKDFEQAYQLSPRQAAFMYNIATAYDKGGERPRAIEWYRRYAEAIPEEVKEVWMAKKRVEVLEKEQRELDAARAATAGRGGGRPRPAPMPFVEPVTKHTYQTVIQVEGQPYTLVGAGARKVWGFKVYAMALYVEDEPARAAFPKLAQQAGGSDHDTLLHSDLAAKFVVMGDFGKAAVLHFVRAVSAKDTRDSYRKALADTFSERAPSELRRDAEAFLQLFDDIKEGEDLVIRTSADGQLIVEAGGKKKLGPKNRRLTYDVWDIWLGVKPISGDLKKTILDRVDTLGR